LAGEVLTLHLPLQECDMALDDRPGSGGKRKRFALLVILLLVIVAIIFVGFNIFYVTIST